MNYVGELTNTNHFELDLSTEVVEESSFSP